MGEQRTPLCTKNFKVWVAFLMGMVVIVLAIIVFDRVLGIGGLATPASAQPSTPVAQSTAPTQSTATAPAATTNASTVSFLSLTKSEDGSAWLGIEAADVPKATAEKLGLDIDGGVFVSKVLPGSPADNGGLLRGDIIYQFDHRKVSSVDDLVNALKKLDPDDRVRVVLLRTEEREVLYVKLGVVSNSTTAVRTVAGELTAADQKWGIAVSELTSELRAAYDIPKREKGVVIVMVVPGSAAQRSGLRNGDLVKQVDREDTENLAAFFAALKDSSRHVLLRIYRDGKEFFVHVIAIAPGMQTGGGEDDDDDDEEAKGYKGQPAPFPPMGKPTETSSLVAPSTTATAMLTSDGKGDDEDKPVCKRVQDLEQAL